MHDWHAWNFHIACHWQLVLVVSIIVIDIINLMLLPLFIYRSTTSTFRSILLLCVLLLFSHIVEKEIPLPNSPSPKKKSQNNMEKVEDIVIVGAGIAGLTTSLGLQKYSSSLSYICICMYYIFLIFGLILKNCYSAYVQFLSPFS